MALFDTDVLIDHLRGYKGARDLLLSFQDDRNYCSVITTGEILFGMKEHEREKTSLIVRLAHDVKSRAKGAHLELYDCIIAATAIKFKQILVTGNSRHYPDERLTLFVPDYPLDR